MIFFLGAYFFVIPNMSELKRKPREIFKVNKVENKAEAVELFGSGDSKMAAPKMSGSGITRDKDNLDKMLLRKPKPDELALKNKIDEMREDVEEDKKMSDEKLFPGDVLKIEAGRVKKEGDPGKRSLLKQLPGRATVAAASGEREGFGGMDYKMDRKGFNWNAPIAALPGDQTKGGYYRPGEREFAGGGGRGRVGNYEDISDMLDVKIFKYADPASGEKYFELVITAKPKADFKVLAKELIFLIDSSKSITPDKLETVKKGMNKVLKALAPEDRFNVVAFRGELTKFQPKSVNVNGKFLKDAQIFVNSLSTTGQTDVNNALMGIVSDQVEFVPSYVILITDGRPTTGVTNSKRIIQEITRKNEMARPVFAFGGGDRVNKYLLNFISYQNRGWSTFSDRTFQMEEDLLSLYHEIDSPILLNVRYRVNGIDINEVYPKYLPDFFKGGKFRVYGRYDSEDEVFSMQLLGEMSGGTKELLFRKSLHDAEQGDASIAREWAFSKIYYLISEDTLNTNSDKKSFKEIDNLSKKYGIVTPYNAVERD